MAKKSGRIMAFKEVGWTDPFKKVVEEKKKVPVKMDSSTILMKLDEKFMNALGAKKKKKGKAPEETPTYYDHKTIHYINKYGTGETFSKPLYALGLPSDMLMFNIMRACMGVRRIEDLWFQSIYEKKLIYNL